MTGRGFQPEGLRTEGPYIYQKPTRPKAAGTPEPVAKAALECLLRAHFEPRRLRSEVSGTSALGVEVRVDYLCYPATTTIIKGWPEEWFALEAKGHELQDQRKKTACRLLHQAIIYSQSTFRIADRDIRPYFVLVYPSFAKLLCGTNDEGDSADFYSGFALALAKTAGMFRVGELNILSETDFEVYFHGKHRQYSSRRGWANVDWLGKRNDHASR